MKKEEARLVVIVQPNARRNEIKDFSEGALYLKIAAPPTEGKANRELINYLSEILGVAKSRISVEKGLKAKKKSIGVTGLNQEQVTDILDNATKA
jgi:uncharacterized protein (TIGR00251 family)